ncbi:uncharacterized protein LOC126907788 isoform X3 [Daktulosphaira vitifoliae]|uniref:uncharacterized protein LOC126907788 isoform X3 n=1 Tax=Daktulosphaira vitifoliae TaxID=58002 RepID=UPI0021AA66F3|nr:uncharacterized protein LOC126907788 isoform X3 [Daktulosphaira vitifoliae]
MLIRQKMILLKIISLLHIHLTLGLSFYYLQCNFLMYMLNYFNHNNRYLIEMSENIKKYDVHSLSKYGDAIKTHGEIVLVMLDVLRNADKTLYSTELMSVNLYLNNVSEYIDFYAKNNDGIYDLSDQSSSILKGYKMVHDFFLEQFKKKIIKLCKNVIYDQIFIYSPDYNESGEYTLENIQCVTKKLKNRLLQTDKYQNDTDYYTKKLGLSKVYNVFSKAIKRSKYWEFLPKNLIYYDLMTRNCEISEKEIMRSSQDKQYPLLINGRNDNVLDIIRFAPLAIKCKDKSSFTLFDIFRYVKYTFYRKDIEVFHTLILTATFRPIAILVRLFIRVLCSSTYIYDFHSSQKEPLKFYKNIISVGERIIECFQQFVNMNLFGDGPTDVFFSFSKKTSKCLNNFINKNKLNLKLSTIELIQELKSFLYNNKFEFIYLSGLVTKDIINNCFNELVENLNQVEEYLANLDSQKEFFKVTIKTFNINHMLDIKYTHVFNRFIIRELCKTKDIYTMLYKFNDDYVKQIDEFGDKSAAIDDKIRNKIVRHQNHPEIITQNIDRCELNNYNFYPKYLIDYILYI